MYQILSELVEFCRKCDENLLMCFTVQSVYSNLVTVRVSSGKLFCDLSYYCAWV